MANSCPGGDPGGKGVGVDRRGRKAAGNLDNHHYDCSAVESLFPDRRERARLRQVEAFEHGVGEGVVADRRDFGGDHEQAFEGGGIESAFPD
eukprot:scaffold110269_cov51-Phaeocystis_antarctica.AAC.1